MTWREPVWIGLFLAIVLGIMRITHPLPSGMVLVYAVAFCALLAAHTARWLWRRPDELRTTRLINGCCPHCGYNLKGNTSGLCPECGHPA